MFVDASVIVAVLTEEPDAEALSSDIEQASGLFTSPVGLFEAVVAIAALGVHARYGKGSGHPASLNLGDCFAYAMANHHGVPLLYKGDDFAQTDLA